MIETVLELPTLALLALLILAFVVAFKLLEMVFETIMVSVLSGAFYLGLVFIFSYPLTIDRVLLFAFLGSALYMSYSILASAYTIFSKVIGIPYKLIKATLRYSSAAASKKRKKDWEEKMKRYSEKMELYADKVEAKAERSANEQKEESRDVKEVVLDKVKDEDEEES